MLVSSTSRMVVSPAGTGSLNLSLDFRVGHGATGCRCQTIGRSEKRINPAATEFFAQHLLQRGRVEQAAGFCFGCKIVRQR